ncbi:hypothetical protein [Pseudodesulfovibrio pelocollis]|uniref:hypothetical protein n=1 Tax=Pseudodesulfovibrio pelocollis TaxID=3051432 RepID=UPI00255B0B08|nr:hypothetical protein [Pseudodesulfovibrio sp. SB368]
MSISTESVSALTENLMRGADTVKETTSTVLSAANRIGPDTGEQAVAGAEVASRTSDFFGSGTDLGSTGTDYDTAQAVNNTIMSGRGAVADLTI